LGFLFSRFSFFGGLGGGCILHYTTFFREAFFHPVPGVTLSSLCFDFVPWSPISLPVFSRILIPPSFILLYGRRDPPTGCPFAAGSFYFSIGTLWFGDFLISALFHGSFGRERVLTPFASLTLFVLRTILFCFLQGFDPFCMVGAGRLLIKPMPRFFFFFEELRTKPQRRSFSPCLPGRRGFFFFFASVLFFLWLPLVQSGAPVTPRSFL